MKKNNRTWYAVQRGSRLHKGWKFARQDPQFAQEVAQLRQEYDVIPSTWDPVKPGDLVAWRWPTRERFSTSGHVVMVLSKTVQKKCRNLRVAT